MKNIVIAPVGENLDSLFVGIREFPTEKVILISTPESDGNTQRMREDLEKFKIPVDVHEIGSGSWRDIFGSISNIKKSNKDKSLLINVSTGDNHIQSALTSAAFVNGIKAFSVMDNDAFVLPVLDFNYYDLLTEKKMGIMGIISEKEQVSIEELSQRTGMSLPLISYHINGSQKASGLKEMGLVEAADKKGKSELKLTNLGRILVEGRSK